MKHLLLSSVAMLPLLSNGQATSDQFPIASPLASPGVSLPVTSVSSASPIVVPSTLPPILSPTMARVDCK